MAPWWVRENPWSEHGCAVYAYFTAFNRTSRLDCLTTDNVALSVVMVEPGKNGCIIAQNSENCVNESFAPSDSTADSKNLRRCGVSTETAGLPSPDAEDGTTPPAHLVHLLNTPAHKSRQLVPPTSERPVTPTGRILPPGHGARTSLPPPTSSDDRPLYHSLRIWHWNPRRQAKFALRERRSPFFPILGYAQRGLSLDRGIDTARP